jgi:hypothetical protein
MEGVRLWVIEHVVLCRSEEGGNEAENRPVSILDFAGRGGNFPQRMWHGDCCNILPGAGD